MFQQILDVVRGGGVGEVRASKGNGLRRDPKLSSLDLIQYTAPHSVLLIHAHQHYKSHVAHGERKESNYP
jgi:hypothetical protein